MTPIKRTELLYQCAGKLKDALSVAEEAKDELVQRQIQNLIIVCISKAEAQ